MQNSMVVMMPEQSCTVRWGTQSARTLMSVYTSSFLHPDGIAARMSAWLNVTNVMSSSDMTMAATPVSYQEW